jgi:hypothetical protein
MKLKNVAIPVLAALLSSAHAGAQVVASLVAASEIPAGSVCTPHPVGHGDHRHKPVVWR